MNVVQGHAFSEMLAEVVQNFQNRAIQAAEGIEELIRLTRKMREAKKRGEDLGLNDDEIAFYETTAAQVRAMEVLGNDTLKKIATK